MLKGGTPVGIVQENSGTFTGSGFTVTLPVASSPSNTVVVIVAGNTTVTTPSGFTLRTSQVNFMGHYLWDRVGGASSWAFTNSAGQGTWYVVELTGAYQNATSANAGNSSFTYNTPTLTPTAGARTLLASIGSTTTGVVRTVSGWTNGFTEEADVCQASADYPMQGVASLSVTANGSTGYSTTATYTSASVGRSAIIASYTDTGAGGPTAVTGTDSGACTDDATNLLLDIVDDQGATTDTSAMLRSSSVVDASMWAESVTVILTVSATDTGTATDGSSVVLARFTGSDSSTMGEQLLLQRSSAGSDSSSWSDSTTGQAIATTSDAGALSDTSGVFVGLNVAASDAGATSEQLLLGAVVSSGDPGTVADTSTLTAATTAGDAGAGGDSSSVFAGVNLTGTDSGNGADSSLPAVTISRTDQGATAEAIAGAVILAATDTGATSDSSVLSGSGGPAGADTGSASDAATVQVTLSTTDPAGSADTSAPVWLSTLTDTGTGADASALEVLGVTITGADPATFAEQVSLSAALSGAEPASQVESPAGVAVVLARVDTAAGTDTSASGRVAVLGDAGVMTEQLVFGVVVTVADVGGWLEVGQALDLTVVTVVRRFVGRVVVGAGWSGRVGGRIRATIRQGWAGQ